MKILADFYIFRFTGVRVRGILSIEGSENIDYVN
jgi:hypothetical protein